MARPTRQQRRARRGESSESSLAEQTRASRQSSTLRTQKPGNEPKAERRRRFRFIGESVGELKKVEWPGRQQLVQGTVVVIIACAIVGGYLAICDQAFKHLVKSVLIG
ncbi:MAG: preprotein translocase subunit SecE [Gaiellaceae bacterium]